MRDDSSILNEIFFLKNGIPLKGWLVQDVEQQSSILEKHNHYGNVHVVEKLRQSIEIWYATSEYLRQEMNPNFRMTLVRELRSLALELNHFLVSEKDFQIQRKEV